MDMYDTRSICMYIMYIYTGICYVNMYHDYLKQCMDLINRVRLPNLVVVS